jgi:hypothetical protein
MASLVEMICERLHFEMWVETVVYWSMLVLTTPERPLTRDTMAMYGSRVKEF